MQSITNWDSSCGTLLRAARMNRQFEPSSWQAPVARFQGYAYGAGFNLALAADFRVMARDARLATPFIKRGLATGTNLLQQYVGIGKAIEMTLLGEPIEAEEALRLGLVNEVVAPAMLDE